MHRLTTTRRGLLCGAVAAGLSLVAMAGLWLLFAPLSLGGSFSYAVVSGDSMEPGLTTDDVVLLRGSHDYAVGDVVAYRHPQLGPVLHRIIAFEGARMVLQGDNRGSPDSYRPVAADVIGRSWVTIPAAGGVVRELQRPRNAILLVVAALALALWSRGSLPAARQRGRRVAALGLRSRSGVALFSFYSPSSRTFFSALIVLVLLSGGAFLFARVDGPTQTVVQSFGYEQRGTFSYGEVVGEGVYDADLLTAPQPLFRTLQDRLPFDFTYDLTSPRTGPPLTNVTGSYEVVAEVRREDGWSRTFQLQPPTLFAGPAFASSVVLDLAEVDRRLDAAAEATGIAANLYRVAVIAGVRVEGELGGLPFSNSHQQRLEFRLTPLQLMFDVASSELEAGSVAAVAYAAQVPRTFSVPLISLSVPATEAPTLSAIGLAAAAAGLLVMALATIAVWRGGPAARIRAMYGHLLVTVGDGATSGRAPLAIGEFEHLVRIAEHDGSAILHRATARGDEYFIVGRDALYRYWEPHRSKRGRGRVRIVGETPGGLPPADLVA